VSIYSASSEETLRARKLLSAWFGDGLLTKDQYDLLETETLSELRTTNIFLRLVLFLFTLVSVGAAAGLFFAVFLSRSSDQPAGVFFLIFGVICYAAAELVVSRFRLYRYGIEEALAVCSIVFLCVGMHAAFFGNRSYSSEDAAQSLIPAAGVVLSLWIWRRFGFSYAFLAAMIFVVFLPGYWISSLAVEHVMVAALYAIGLADVVAVRSRHRLDYLDERYSLVESMLWFGIYLAINLQVSRLDFRMQASGGSWTAPEFGRPFYWITWVLIWCLPPMVLTRGIRQKDRFVIVAGAIMAVLTFVSNKPYLGWTRHSWDPMLLGILLTGVAIFIRRWLDRGAEGIRYGITAVRLSGKDQRWLNAVASAAGLLSPQVPAPQPSDTDFHFGGGSSGGGGAGGDF